MSIRNTLLLLLITTGIVVALAPPRAWSQASQPLLGYAWSDTIGWIDLNCENSGTCATNPFGLSVDSSEVVTGYAWSDNIGWVSAYPADLGLCPSGPCSARLSSSYFAGWLRALSGGTPQSGAWDGFISLSGSDYGVTRSGGIFGGFAWGDTVVGWVDFTLGGSEPECAPTYSCVGNAVHNSCTGEDVPCLPSDTCIAGACIPPAPPPPPTATLRVSPALTRSGATTQVIWTSTNTASCAVSEDNPDINDAWTSLSDTQTSSPITKRTTYTLSCTGIDGSTLTKTATVSNTPIFREI